MPSLTYGIGISSTRPDRDQVNIGFCYVLAQFSKTNGDIKLLIIIMSEISDTLDIK